MARCINLEPLCAKWGMSIVECDDLKSTDKENLINKALGVLAENGLYAMNVFLLSCNQKRYGEKVFDELLEMLKSPELAITKTKRYGFDALEDIRLITEDLPRLILARKVTEQALIFARYHCKASR